ncbi:putative monosaccharide-p-dolichol utilization [Phaeomoniella chlamydospora]|uniref:Putative monosaccharide-p-dolichol utilization n=1 Tax=Phaeomoniella chlamydospora TaxID=158046 RepID=A0A0G2EQX2_PHACM|nr:putative monosaccharide-p-dolichol utilization [Phaeomoniella chlamydospora]
MDIINTQVLPLVQSNIINPLRPYLTPITHNLPAPINDFLLSLLGTKCHSTLVLNLSLENPDCTSLLISKTLGTVIILASTIVKIPQILKILNSQSSAGLSFLSILLETVSFLITLTYNIRSGWPFSTYGETALILAQDVVIGALVLHFSSKTSGSFIPAAYIAIIASSIYALLSPDLVPSSSLSYLQALAGILSISSKIPQILSNYLNGSTGQLSAFAVFNYLFGSLSRIFTTLAEVDDKLILYGFVAGFTLNAVLAGQMIWYWNSKGTPRHGAEISEKVADVTTGASVSGTDGGNETLRRRR